MPDSSVQGETIPFYILWDKSIKPVIEIDLPQGLIPEEIYNVKPESLELQDSKVTISDVEVNGYLGGTFESGKYAEASLNKTVRFSILENEPVNFDRTIELFRPDVRLVDSPEEISITVLKDGGLRIDNHIRVENLGKGTGYIRLKVSPGSQVEESASSGYEEFRRNFNNGLDNSPSVSICCRNRSGIFVVSSWWIATSTLKSTSLRSILPYLLAKDSRCLSCATIQYSVDESCGVSRSTLRLTRLSMKLRSSM